MLILTIVLFGCLLVAGCTVSAGFTAGGKEVQGVRAEVTMENDVKQAIFDAADNRGVRYRFAGECIASAEVDDCLKLMGWIEELDAPDEGT